MVKVVLLCVLYNKKSHESETIQSYLNLDHSEINKDNCLFEMYVWDNSRDKELQKYNDKFCKDHGINYHRSSKNEKLSVIYNKFLKFTNNGYLIIFDDDSVVGKSYFIEVSNLIKEVKFCVALPKIKSQIGTLYSPAEMKIVRGKHLIEISDGFQSGLIGITSGIVLNCSMVMSEKITFDEYLNLYGIDTDFFLEMQRKKIPVYVLKYVLNHDLSCFNDESASIKRMRFINSMKANIYISKKRGLSFFILTVIYYFAATIKNIFLLKG